MCADISADGSVDWPHTSFNPDPRKQACEKMKELPAKYAYTIAIIGGAALWLVTRAVSGRSEAWDSSLYWSAAYPLAIGLSAMLGYLAPTNPWRWALAVMLVQAVVLAATAAGFGLLPLGLILFAILALPPIAAAMALARFRIRRARTVDEKYNKIK
jgi:hypothetical protein